MAWDSTFLGHLADRSYRPRVRFVVWEPLVGSSPGVPSEWGPDGVEDFTTFSASVEPVTWRSSLGGFSITYRSDRPQYIAQYIKRGTFLAVHVDLAGLPDADWPVVALGRVSGVRASPRGVVISCLDLWSALSSRPERADPSGNLPLFNDVAGSGSFTTISTTDYTAGDSTLYVNSVGAFSKDSDTSGPQAGLLKITPTTGDPFYLRWTAKNAAPTPDEFTVETTGYLGTTAVDASVGDRVDHIAYVHDHPLDVARKVVVSTGGSSGSNGAYDRLPEPWGYGIPDAYVDHSDIDDWKARMAAGLSSGSYVLDVYSEAAQSNGYTWLLGVLQPYGCFPTMRQGQLTVRAGFTPWGQPVVDTLNHHDIESVVSHELYGGPGAAQAAGVEVLGPIESSTTQVAAAVATLPAVRYQTYDLSAFNWANNQPIREEVRDRMSHCLVVGEDLKLRLAGLRKAWWTPGDHVRVTSHLLWGRLEGPGETYDSRRALVTGVSVAWLQGTVEVSLWLPPNWTDTHS